MRFLDFDNKRTFRWILSILFMRFRNNNNSKIVQNSGLSILFMRFFLSITCKLSWYNFQFSLWDSYFKLSQTTNSTLFFQFSLWDSRSIALAHPLSNALPFNSLYEILYCEDEEFLVDLINFQFSLWDSAYTSILKDTGRKSFNSLYEILLTKSRTVAGFTNFQFSLWDSGYYLLYHPPPSPDFQFSLWDS
mgnify:CR=1 FL=1